MEPITTAIVAAIAGGATAGTAELGKKAFLDAYTSLKTLITKKFGQESDVAEAVEKLEKRPDSDGRKATLQEELVRVGADQAPDVLQAAKLLLAAVVQHAKQGGSIGVSMEDVKAAEIRIDSDIERGTGVDMKHIETSGTIDVKSRVRQDPNA